MKLAKIDTKKKLYFGCHDLAKLLNISEASARVTASRYVKQGLLIRVKRNLYVLRERWESAGREEQFMLANLGQVPSYISLMTALEYYQVTTQMQRDFIESVAVKRTKEIRLNHTLFRYTRVSKDLYCDFNKHKGFFIAVPEKAFLDAMYLVSFGRYSLDFASIDAEKLDRRKLMRMSMRLPLKTQKLLRNNGYL